MGAQLHTPERRSRNFKKYPWIMNDYVVPEDLVISLQAGIDYYRSQQAAEHKAQNEDHNVVDLICTPSSADDTTLAVWVTPELDLFSRYINVAHLLLLI
ncbi:hypothetical protein PPTG_24994 [Phytophthora nicotianae INRA-310]|uniref:Uncharacterized protein n=1 Tax=Phytophthora nicotianae (strain INRA-310) TaxID=761204 RepID=W2P9N3_PHYN3|nr:hypothetical protein PPTG_24994 [Phytophthora nicotianae INRA-310]ETM97355.1 hypothetical protein PPTG_24994 [Phytophthora nicotianae INRA-310]